MIFTISFLAGPAKIHQKLKVFASVKLHCGCLCMEFYNSEMYCVLLLLVILLSSRQYSVKCDLQEFWKTGLIHRQAKAASVCEKQAEYVHCHAYSP